VGRRRRAGQYAGTARLRRVAAGEQDGPGVSIARMHGEPHVHRAAGRRALRMHSRRALGLACIEAHRDWPRQFRYATALSQARGTVRGRFLRTIMADPLSRRHASGAVTPELPALEPTYAEKARTLIHLGRVGSLSTMSRKHPGWPFGSVMPYALDVTGRPIFLISSMAMHTQNLLNDPKASLLVTQSEAPDPLGAS